MKSPQARHMTDWEHKERFWNKHVYSARDDNAVVIYDESREDIYFRRNFTEWLDWQCKGGWTVIKISRNFNAENLETWCVFRRN